MADKPKRNSNLVANLAQYQLYANCVRGGRYMRTPPKETFDPAQLGLTPLPLGTYLKPFPNESATAFDIRVRRAAYRNHAQEVVRVYLATLFAQGNAIDRSTVEEDLGPEISLNVDRRGSAIPTFLRSAWRDALIHGWVGCFTDLPRVSDEIVTAQDERDAGIRPYSRLILPTNLWDWQRAADTGVWTMLLIDEGVRVEFKGKHVWSRWTLGEWAIIDSDGTVLEQGEHSFTTELPFDVLICDEADEAEDEPLGHSALRDIADLSVELFNVSSELEDLLKKTNFPMFHIKEDPESVHKSSEGDLPVGADSVLFMRSEADWKSPDTKAAEVAMRQAHELEQQIRRTAGIATRSEESTEQHSGIGLQWEYSTRHSLVKLRAENLRDFEVRWYRRQGQLLNKPVRAESVRYPSDYATLPVPEDITTLKALHEIGAPAAVQQAQLRAVTLKQFFHRPDLPALLAAVEQWEPLPPAGLTTPAAAGSGGK